MLSKSPPKELRSGKGDPIVNAFNRQSIAVAAIGMAALTACAGASSTPPTVATMLGRSAGRNNQCPCIYVTVPYSGAFPRGAIVVFKSGATGDAKPLQYIGGTNTGLSTPSDIA
ncbi:MAG: hypothetical protein JO104_08700, partial [Candidatus Eremiobacteraeota bacterium]|nr:hypothetical protein [Candidatus Eremiobacteraeota bacterium]